MDVKKRHHAKRNVTGSQPVGFSNIVGRGYDIAVREWHSFGPACGTAGVKYQSNMVLELLRRPIYISRPSTGPVKHSTIVTNLNFDNDGLIVGSELGFICALTWHH